MINEEDEAGLWRESADLIRRESRTWWQTKRTSSRSDAVWADQLLHWAGRAEQFDVEEATDDQFREIRRIVSSNLYWMPQLAQQKLNALVHSSAVVTRQAATDYLLFYQVKCCHDLEVLNKNGSWEAARGLLQANEVHSYAVKILTPRPRPELLVHFSRSLSDQSRRTFSMAHESAHAVLLTEGVSDLLYYWNELAVWRRDPEAFPDEQASTIPTGAVLQAVGAAQRASDAAVKAREAAVFYDSTRSREIISSFASHWLGLAPTDRNVDAVGNALLAFDFDGTDPNDGEALILNLKTETFRQVRAWKPLTSTELCWSRVVSLDEPAPAAAHLRDVAEATYGHTLYDPADLIPLGDPAIYEDSRITRILAQLHSRERAVAHTYAHCSQLGVAGTWAAAAIHCGHSPEFGERVRTKLKRLGRDHASRQRTLREGLGLDQVA